MVYILVAMLKAQESRIRSHLNIHITGQPGSGGSTLAKNLEKVLVPIVGPKEVVRFSGGRLRRAAAYLWAEWRHDPQRIADLQESHRYTPDQMDSTSQDPNLTRDLWIQFEQEFAAVFVTNKLQGVMSALEPYFDRAPDESSLQDFNTNQQLYTPDSVLWDYVTEAHLTLISQTAPEPYRIGESKLLVYADRIKELQELVSEHPGWALPTLRLLLKVDPEVAAARISTREDEPVTAEDVLQRRQNDWQRYGQFYSDLDTGEPLTEHHLEAISHVIDTTEKNAEAVLTIALYRLLELLTREGLPEVIEHQQLVHGVTQILAEKTTPTL